jgi:outer membrane protein insertion porin family
LEIVGNTLSLLDKYFPKKGGQSNGQILGLPYYQFVKPELDFRVYRTLGANSLLVFRLAPGLAYAYGRIDSLKSVPFDRQFFVGGPNSLRAWSARQLGPGSFLRIIPTSTSITQDTAALIASQLRGLDQTGEIKLEGNVEYRFLITSDFFGRKLSGASFVDFGNIWLVRPDPTRPEANINFKNVFRQIAIGTGLGIRYDLSFFIFRFDVGVKLYDPIFSNGDGWVIKKFASQAFKDEYLNTYGGRNSAGNPLSSSLGYHFVTYNFGIGLPF